MSTTSTLLNRRVLSDMVLNLLSTAIPTIALQLIILPVLGKEMSSDQYGLLVTTLALLNVVPATIGNTLNNIRLIHDKEYRRNNLEGDFNLILLLMGFANAVLVGYITYYYDHGIDSSSMFLTIIVSLAWMAKEYYCVAFRLEINYNDILISNVVHVLGYGVGYGIYLASNKWQWIYLCGYMFGLIYVFVKSKLWRERLSVTPLFKDTTIQTVLLLIAGLLTRVTIYADKMLIYPLLGGSSTTQYYVATVFGKIVALVVTPITSVLLTYLAKTDRKDNELFNKTLIAGSAVCILGYIFCILFSRPILGLLYPQYIDEAMKYIYITSATTVLFALITIVNPFILNYFTMWWQIAINALSAITYVVLSVGLLMRYGLIGFCVGALLANIIKLIISIGIYYKAKSKEVL